MPTHADIETADRLNRKRARMLPILAILYLMQQATYFMESPDDAMRTVDQVKVSAWIVLSIVLLLVLSTGGSWLRSAAVRALMDDEVTRANRTQALSLGFLVAMITAILLYCVSLYEPLAGRVVIRIVMTFGLGAALLRFGYLERRALKHG